MSQVKFQLAKATWHEDEFQAAMNEIAAVFNGAKSCEEVMRHDERSDELGMGGLRE